MYSILSLSIIALYECMSFSIPSILIRVAPCLSPVICDQFFPVALFFNCHTTSAPLVSGATGLRFSEVLGLKWKDVDFKENILVVNKSFDHMHTKKLKETKTANSNRKIKLDDHTINMLKEYKKQNSKTGS